MAVPKLPQRVMRGNYKKLDVEKYGYLRLRQRFHRFTLLWTDNNGVPYNTTGFFATARTLGGTLIQTVRFDSYGTAVFTFIPVPLTTSIVIRTYNSVGVLYRTRTVPAGITAFVIFP